MLNPTFRHILRCPIWATYIDHTWVSSFEVFCYLILCKTEERFFFFGIAFKEAIGVSYFSVNRWFKEARTTRKLIIRFTFFFGEIIFAKNLVQNS